jgi:molecular chaperone Hsp33
MPGTWEETIDAIENNVKMFTSVTALMKEGKSADDFAALLFKGIEYEKFDTIETEFRCNCSKENYARGIISLGKEELDAMIEEGKDIETQCVFCSNSYPFTVDELKALRNKTTH